jgi:hypothetical protein
VTSLPESKVSTGNSDGISTEGLYGGKEIKDNDKHPDDFGFWG